MRMLGRIRHLKCGWDRCRFCQDGSAVRRHKRKEHRQVEREQLTAMMDRLAKSTVASMKREVGMGGGSGGGAIQVNGFVGSNRELAEVIREVMQEEALRHKRNGPETGP